jgi:hypothetical protein
MTRTPPIPSVNRHTYPNLISSIPRSTDPRESFPPPAALNSRLRRQFIQARNLRQEAAEKVKDFDAILGRLHADYEAIRQACIPCRAFVEGDGEPSTTAALNCPRLETIRVHELPF